jgi:putative addiction module component (TIGR02574 family)
MARSLRQIQEEIRELSASEKEALVRVLLDDLDEPTDPAIDAAWLAESQRRSKEIDDGTVSCVPAEDVFRRIEASLRK